MRNRWASWCVMLLVAGVALAEDRPLQSLPYTPGLDVTAMDRTVDPCVDFYRYSCGGWMAANPIPPDQAAWSVFGKLQHENRLFLWGLLEQAAKPSPDRTPVQRQIGDYFSSCMNEAAVEKAGFAPLLPELDRIAALRSVKGLPRLLAREHLELFGTDVLFGYGSNQDFADSSQVIGFADAGGLGLPDRDYYTNTDARSEEIRRKYVEHLRQMLMLIGESRARAQADARTVMQIETALAEASLTRVDRRDPYKLFHNVTPAELQALTPTFDWKIYLDGLGGPRSADINVAEPEFFRAVEALLKARRLDDWKAYLRWHAVNSAAPYLSSPFVHANFDFYSKFLRGVQTLPPRWRRCVQYVDRDLGEALGRVFVDSTFGPEVKKSTLEMTAHIQSAMESEIGQLPWMGPETKKFAVEKLHAMVDKIGYPNKWRDYSSVAIAPADFAGNVMNASRFEAKRQLAKIGKPVDRDEWFMTPPSVDAYYNQQMNDINFPAGVLQPPLLDPKMDEAPNYGNTGSTIGHEMTHGFDDSGRQYDARGNLKDWWTPEDAREFQQRADCVADQYSGYTVVDDVKINGKLTNGEDIADIGGTVLAYLAWKDATRGMALQPIDGLSPDQRYFVGMAQWACANERPDDKRVRAITDPHSPPEYRVNGVVSDMPEFASAFSCKPGQPMVRAQVCKVW